jgi:hypothetical protein
VSRGREARRRLRPGAHARDRLERHAQRLPRPGAQGRPGRLLALGELQVLVGEVADHVGLRVARDLGGERIARRRRPVERDVDEPRGGHGRRVDALALRGPLGRDDLRQRARADDQRLLGGSLQRPAVEQHGEAAVAGVD